MATVTFRGITYTKTIASSNNRTLTGTENPDWLQALGGDNQLSGLAGNDVLLAGIEVGSIQPFPPFGGEAIVYRPLVDQQGRSIAGNNLINAGSGDDYVATGLGNDIVDLGDGNDIFDGAGGNDLILGGTGNDIVSVIAQDVFYTVVDAGSENDTVLLFSEQGGYNLIDGGSGNDDIAARGNSQINAGSGDDLINIILGSVVNSGGSIVQGGDGQDTIYASNRENPPFAGDNLIYGGAGDDTIVSGKGNDTIYGGQGNDVVNLRRSQVTLRGRLVDLLGTVPAIRGGGEDKVYLGTGRDKVILGSGAGFEAATIYDFGANDRLDVGRLNVSITRQRGDTILSAGRNEIAVLKDYTGRVSFV